MGVELRRLAIELGAVPSLAEITARWLSDELLLALTRFSALVHEWNDRVDLVSRCSADDVVRRHVMDSLGLSLVMTRLAAADAGSIYDIGSGGGFPGVVLATVLPARHVTLVEPRKKRCVFLNEARRRLKLANLSVFEGRFDQFVAQAKVDPMSTVTVRGLTPDAEFLRCSSSLSGGSSYRGFYLTGEAIDTDFGASKLGLSGVGHADFRAWHDGTLRRVFWW